MAEVILSSLVGNLVGKTGSLVRAEVCLAGDLERDLKRLNEDLSAIKSVLLDAEEKQAQNHELHLWLRRLEKFCNEAEDVLDELEYEGLRNQVVKQYGSTKTKVCRLFSSSNPLVFRFKMGDKFKEFRESLDEILAQKSKFHLTEVVDFRPVGNRMRELTDSFVLMSKVFGRDAEKQRIMRFLFHPRDENLDAIAIVGKRGLGKTTLAKMAYNDNRIDGHFELKMWVCISEDGLDKKKTLVKIMNSLTHQYVSDYKLEQIKKFIRDKLNGKKFLLVLDDVWRADLVEWFELIGLLKVGERGSKIIVTTRSRLVALRISTTQHSMVPLGPLSPEDSFLLFKEFAFRGREEERYQAFVGIGKEIVEKVGGIPLAIRTLGRLLYFRMSKQYWMSINENDVWQRKGGILRIFRLSYDELPSHLKPCFAICSIFPKNILLSSHFLIEVWMAHGLIQPQQENEVLEDIGLHFVKELCSRSFFQDIEEIGCTWFFRMHDLMHGLAMKVAHSECMILRQQSLNISKEIRHLSFSDVNALLNTEVPNSLRTIISPQLKLKTSDAQSLVYKCISKCRLLRMLDLKGLSFEVLPSSIGALKHLRYLNLSFNVRIKRLPDSLWTLYNLQSLLLYRCVQLEEIPGKLRRLHKLRFLEFATKQKRLPANVLSSLKCLHHLLVADCNNLEVLLEGTSDLAFLRLLGVSRCGNLKSLASSLKYLAALKTLAISNCRLLDLNELDDDQDAVLSLECLVLGKLPKLITLPQWLQRSSGTLEYMKIYGCEHLSSLPEWLGNFASLSTIEICDCPKLSQLPESMQNLTALKKLVIKRCPALAERCKMDTGVDRHKISHIRTIQIEQALQLPWQSEGSFG